MNKIRILIADDHTILRDGIRSLLALYDDIEVVGVLATEPGGREMAKPINATPVIRGNAAERILEEMRHGTPNTPKRVETIRRADEVYQRSTEHNRERERPSA